MFYEKMQLRYETHNITWVNQYCPRIAIKCIYFDSTHKNTYFVLHIKIHILIYYLVPLARLSLCDYLLLSDKIKSL